MSNFTIQGGLPSLPKPMLSSRFAASDNRIRHILKLHCPAMIKYVDESGRINY